MSVTPEPLSDTSSTMTASDRRDLADLTEIVKRLERELKGKKKDLWDKLQALSVLISGVLVAFIGAYATQLYNGRQLQMTTDQNQRELAVNRVQVVERFFPHLISKDEEEKGAALDAIASLGDEALATRLAFRFGGEGGVSALSKLTGSPDASVATAANRALDRVLISETAETFVYLVTATSCGGSESRTGTGFRVKEITGIITSLHLVSNCSTVMASSSHGTLQLTLTRVDIEHDAALLTESRQGTPQSTGLASATISKELRDGKIIAYPLSIRSPIRTTIQFATPPLRELRELLPPNALGQLSKRASPSVDIRVLVLEGTVVPGQAGAPVFDDSGSVIGIVNGGLQAGGGIAWAVPLQDIQWTPAASVSDRLKSLDKNTSLF